MYVCLCVYTGFSKTVHWKNRFTEDVRVEGWHSCGHSDERHEKTGPKRLFGCLGYIGDEILRRLYGDSIKPKDP